MRDVICAPKDGGWKLLSCLLLKMIADEEHLLDDVWRQWHAYKTENAGSNPVCWFLVDAPGCESLTYWVDSIENGTKKLPSSVNIPSAYIEELKQTQGEPCSKLIIPPSLVLWLDKETGQSTCSLVCATIEDEDTLRYLGICA